MDSSRFADQLKTARTINGVSFDGTANITIADNTKAPLASPALTGNQTIAGIKTFSSNIVGNVTGNITGNSGTATKLSTTRLNYKTSTDSVVVGELMWKNYGNNHTIFDASASTSPTGADVNNTNPDYPWGPTYPTLMGYNGTNTYGVRVDSSRYAESASKANTINNSGNSLTFNWSGQGGQPTWLYGGNDPSNAYVYNPSNFSVNYANSAGYASSVAAATPTSSGGIKARLDGTTLFITTNGSNA